MTQQQEQGRSINQRGLPTDSLLQSYLACDQAAAAEKLLQELIGTARPIIEGIVRRRLVFYSASEIQDREDVCGEVIVELLRRLHALREDENETAVPIESFSGYVAASAQHACDEYLRHKHPQRRRLKTRLRYLLSTEARFAVWEDAASPGKDWLCGLKAWQLQGIERANPRESWPEVSAALASDRSRQGVVAMLTAIFDAAKAPILLDELVSVMARLWGVSDRVVQIDPERWNASLGPDPESYLLERRDLERLWNEIGQLPISQRSALLLNLRSGEGDSPIVFFPVMGIASIRQIAEVLQIPATEFAALWNQLPVDDQMIAARLGVTRQQVINLRKSARERLRRRIAS